MQDETRITDSVIVEVTGAQLESPAEDAQLEPELAKGPDLAAWSTESDEDGTPRSVPRT